MSAVRDALQLADRGTAERRYGVDKSVRSALKRQRPCAVWFTGLSGAGKSTIADLVERELAARAVHTYLLDGDHLRRGLNCDLGFGRADRVENLRRASEVATLLVDAGLVVLCAFIAPFRAERRMIRERFEPGEYVEVYVEAPIEICRQRDPKGLYARVAKGEIANFTGVDSPYEVPECPDLVLPTWAASPERLCHQVIQRLEGMNALP
jgi:bifunctional enzyme CysN/CysC